MHQIRARALQTPHRTHIRCPPILLLFEFVLLLCCSSSNAHHFDQAFAFSLDSMLFHSKWTLNTESTVHSNKNVNFRLSFSHIFSITLQWNVECYRSSLTSLRRIYWLIFSFSFSTFRVLRKLPWQTLQQNHQIPAKRFHNTLLLLPVSISFATFINWANSIIRCVKNTHSFAVEFDVWYWK